MWDLSSIYASDEAWEADLAQVRGLLGDAAAVKGTLGASATALATGLDTIMAARRATERVVVYATMRRDADATNPPAVAMHQRGRILAVEAGTALGFLPSELLTIPPDVLQRFAADPLLAPYRFLLREVERQRPHRGSDEVEAVLGRMAPLTRTPRDVFQALDNADLDFGTIHDASGVEVPLTKASQPLLFRSQDRAVRRAAHEQVGAAYLAHRHTLAALYGASVRTDVFLARVRGYPSARAAGLFDDAISERVYDGLLTAVREAAPLTERYLDLRRRVLGLDELVMYDLFVPLVPASERQYPYGDAVDLVLDALHPLGEHYVFQLGAGLRGGWVDVNERRGKRGGAYAWGVYREAPRILLNWNGTLPDVYGLAHEAGHAMHRLFADAAQPYQTASYSKLTGEVAAIVNELLLTRHLLAGAGDAETRLAILDRFADQITQTLIAQALYADFEQQAHALAERGEPLIWETLTGTYEATIPVYFPGMTIDDATRVDWARVPHFYRPFYVFRYALGMAAALALERAIIEEGEPAAIRYLALLAAGGSDHPLVLLRKAGVDLEEPEPLRRVLATFGEVEAELEQITRDG